MRHPSTGRFHPDHIAGGDGVHWTLGGAVHPGLRALASSNGPSKREPSGGGEPSPTSAYDPGGQGDPDNLREGADRFLNPRGRVALSSRRLPVGGDYGSPRPDNPGIS